MRAAAIFLLIAALIAAVLGAAAVVVVPAVALALAFGLRALQRRRRFHPARSKRPAGEAFSDPMELDPRADAEPLDLNVTILQMRGVLERALGQDVELSLELSPSLEPVAIDPASLSQVVMSLAANSGDAIEGTGRVEIATSMSSMPMELRGVEDDRYVKLEVSDTGTGIPEDIRDRVFDPFFTTRSSSSGRGLGLSTVKATVERFGGAISLTSRVGNGTRVAIYLPVSPRPLTDDGAERVAPAIAERMRIE